MSSPSSRIQKMLRRELGGKGRKIFELGNCFDFFEKIIVRFIFVTKYIV